MKIVLIFALKATKSTSNYPLNITPSTHIRKFHHKIIKNNNNTKTPEVKLVAKIKEISSLITKKNFKNTSKMFLFGCREKKPKLKISNSNCFKPTSPHHKYSTQPKRLSQNLSPLPPFLEFPSNQTDPDQQTKPDIRVRSKEYLTGIARGEKESRARS